MNLCNWSAGIKTFYHGSPQTYVVLVFILLLLMLMSWFCNCLDLPHTAVTSSLPGYTTCKALASFGFIEFSRH